MARRTRTARTEKNEKTEKTETATESRTAVPAAAGDGLSPGLVSRWRRLATVVMFAACAVLALTTSRRNSITVDEFGNLPRGLHIWHDRDYSLDAETTPLASMLAALPVTLSESVDLAYRSNRPGTP